MMTTKEQLEILNYVKKKFPDQMIIIVVQDDNGNVQEFGYGCRKCSSELFQFLADKTKEFSHTCDYKVM
jgi:hypothetical protein